VQSAEDCGHVPDSRIERATGGSGHSCGRSLPIHSISERTGHLRGAQCSTSFLETPFSAHCKTAPAKEDLMADSDRPWLPMAPLQAALERCPVNKSTCQQLHEASSCQEKQIGKSSLGAVTEFSLVQVPSFALILAICVKKVQFAVTIAILLLQLQCIAFPYSGFFIQGVGTTVGTYTGHRVGHIDARAKSLNPSAGCSSMMHSGVHSGVHWHCGKSPTRIWRAARLLARSFAP
jgi:hypothetical protein